VTWWALVVVAVGTYLFKAAGPVAFATLRIGPRLTRVFTLVAVTLLAALIAVSTLTTAGAITIDARLAGLAAAVIAIALRAPFVVVVGAAAITAAALRAVGVAEKSSRGAWSPIRQEHRRRQRASGRTAGAARAVPRAPLCGSWPPSRGGRQRYGRCSS
jgi:branched-subunit amino acid transport protein